jgi:hypothetical protein
MSEKNVDTKKKMVLSAIQQIEKRASKEIVVDQVRETVQTSYKSPEDSEMKELKNEVNNIETKFFEENPIRLFVDYSHTIPMRPYESAKISVGLSIPIGKQVDESMKAKIDEVYQYASKYIEDKMGKEVAEIQKYLASNKK